MKIKEIRAVTVDLSPIITTKPRVEKQATDGFISHMRRYPEFRRTDWTSKWKRTACVVYRRGRHMGLGRHYQR